MSYENFLTSDQVITKQATFNDGAVADVHFKKCAHIDFERWRAAENSGDPHKVERGKQIFIARCLVDVDGKRALSDQDSVKLTAEGVAILFPLTLEASGIVNRADMGKDSGEEVSSTSNDTSP